jgi:hypothetical protein
MMDFPDDFLIQRIIGLNDALKTQSQSTDRNSALAAAAAFAAITHRPQGLFSIKTGSDLLGELLGAGPTLCRANVENRSLDDRVSASSAPYLMEAEINHVSDQNQTSKGGIPCYREYWNANDTMLQDGTAPTN